MLFFQIFSRPSDISPPENPSKSTVAGVGYTFPSGPIARDSKQAFPKSKRVPIWEKTCDFNASILSIFIPSFFAFFTASIISFMPLFLTPLSRFSPFPLVKCHIKCRFFMRSFAINSIKSLSSLIFASFMTTDTLKGMLFFCNSLIP